MARRGLLCACGRPVTLIKRGSQRKVFKFAFDHDLCSRCWKALNDSSRIVEMRRVTKRKNKNG